MHVAVPSIWKWIWTVVVQVWVAASMNAQWDTSSGVVKGTEFGSGTKLAITIHGMNPTLVNEWQTVAARLAEEGYHVLSPNFHSNPKTAPRSLTDPDTITVLRDLMTAAGATRIAMLLGKSWGGGRALTFAIQSDVLDRLVLVAPAGSPEGTVSCPTALFWAEDDPMIPVTRSERVRKALEHEYLFHLEPVGGHSVLPQYADYIASFGNADFSPDSKESALGVNEAPEHLSEPPYEPPSSRVWMWVLVAVCISVGVLLSLHLPWHIRKSAKDVRQRPAFARVIGAAE